jgi:hypothetical protein
MGPKMGSTVSLTFLAFFFLANILFKIHGLTELFVATFGSVSQHRLMLV